jgi:hypothetical protein
MDALMTFAEIQERYNNKEDPFDLTLEKWIRIRRYLENPLTRHDFGLLLQASNIAVPFCFEYQPRNCAGCPLEEMCGRGGGEKLLRVIRLIQAYVLAGDMLPVEPLVFEVDRVVMELEALKAQHKGQLH